MGEIVSFPISTLSIVQEDTQHGISWRKYLMIVQYHCIYNYVGKLFLYEFG